MIGRDIKRISVGMNGDDDDNILLDLGGFGDWVFSPDSIELSVGICTFGFLHSFVLEFGVLEWWAGVRV